MQWLWMMEAVYRPLILRPPLPRPAGGGKQTAPTRGLVVWDGKAFAAAVVPEWCYGWCLTAPLVPFVQPSPADLWSPSGWQSFGEGSRGSENLSHLQQGGWEDGMGFRLKGSW